jgi:hypothetical protein
MSLWINALPTPSKGTILGKSSLGSCVPVRSFALMDYIEKALEKLSEWVDRVLEALFGPEPQGEHDLIPIPVEEPRR